MARSLVILVALVAYTGLGSTQQFESALDSDLLTLLVERSLDDLEPYLKEHGILDSKKLLKLNLGDLKSMGLPNSEKYKLLGLLADLRTSAEDISTEDASKIGIVVALALNLFLPVSFFYPDALEELRRHIIQAHSSIKIILGIVIIGVVVDSDSCNLVLDNLGMSSVDTICKEITYGWLCLQGYAVWVRLAILQMLGQMACGFRSLHRGWRGLSVCNLAASFSSLVAITFSWMGHVVKSMWCAPYHAIASIACIFRDYLVTPIYNYILAPICNYALSPVGRILYDYLFMPICWILETIRCISVEYLAIPIYEYILAPIGRTLYNYLAMPIYNYILAPIGRILYEYLFMPICWILETIRRISVEYLAIPIYEYILIPIGHCLGMPFKYLYIYAYAPIHHNFSVPICQAVLDICHTVKTIGRILYDYLAMPIYNYILAPIGHMLYGYLAMPIYNYILAPIGHILYGYLAMPIYNYILAPIGHMLYGYLAMPIYNYILAPIGRILYGYLAMPIYNYILAPTGHILYYYLVMPIYSYILAPIGRTLYNYLAMPIYNYILAPIGYIFYYLAMPIYSYILVPIGVVIPHLITVLATSSVVALVIALVERLFHGPWRHTGDHVTVKRRGKIVKVKDGKIGVIHKVPTQYLVEFRDRQDNCKMLIVEQTWFYHNQLF